MVLWGYCFDGFNCCVFGLFFNIIDSRFVLFGYCEGCGSENDIIFRKIVICIYVIGMFWVYGWFWDGWMDYVLFII